MSTEPSAACRHHPSSTADAVRQSSNSSCLLVGLKAKCETCEARGRNRHCHFRCQKQLRQQRVFSCVRPGGSLIYLKHDERLLGDLGAGGRQVFGMCFKGIKRAQRTTCAFKHGNFPIRIDSAGLPSNPCRDILIFCPSNGLMQALLRGGKRRVWSCSCIRLFSHQLQNRHTVAKPGEIQTRPLNHEPVSLPLQSSPSPSVADVPPLLRSCSVQMKKQVGACGVSWRMWSHGGGLHPPDSDYLLVHAAVFSWRFCCCNVSRAAALSELSTTLGA